MAVVAAAVALVVVVVLVAGVVVWVLLRLLRKSISTWSGSSWSTLLITSPLGRLFDARFSRSMGYIMGDRRRAKEFSDI
jgi:hypothetical protein